MILAYTNSDTTASVVIGIIALAIGIAMLVFFISHMSRQTKGIEEIYKLLYQMQAKKPSDGNNDEANDCADENNSDAPVSEYLQDLKEREERDRQYAEPPKDKPMTKGERIVFGICMGIIAALCIVIIIYSIAK